MMGWSVYSQHFTVNYVHVLLHNRPLPRCLYRRFFLQFHYQCLHEIKNWIHFEVEAYNSSIISKSRLLPDEAPFFCYFKTFVLRPSLVPAPFPFPRIQEKGRQRCAFPGRLPPIIAVSSHPSLTTQALRVKSLESVQFHTK